MELRDLRYFLTLAEEGSFTRAAARCWVSQQAFSKAIARLERQLGTLLVVRRVRGCSLTPAGARLALAARDLLERADRLGGVAGAPDPGRLRVGVLLDGLGPLTPRVLAAYRAANPSIPVSVRRVQPHELPGALVAGLVDVALVHGPVADERVETVPLLSEPRVAALSAADERADAERLSAADLLTLPARTRRPAIDPAWEGFFTLVEQRNGEEPARVGEPTRSLEELLWSISMDRLFLTMPQHLAATYPGDRFGVAYVPVPDLPAVVFSVARRRTDHRPAVGAFVASTRAVTGVELRSG
jgi:DNA-binding transcriptional LysR family regulator